MTEVERIVVDTVRHREAAVYRGWIIEYERPGWSAVNDEREQAIEADRLTILFGQIDRIEDRPSVR